MRTHSRASISLQTALEAVVLATACLWLWGAQPVLGALFALCAGTALLIVVPPRDSARRMGDRLSTPRTLSAVGVVSFLVLELVCAGAALGAIPGMLAAFFLGTPGIMLGTGAGAAFGIYLSFVLGREIIGEVAWKPPGEDAGAGATPVDRLPLGSNSQ